MSAESDDSIENIDFGGRLARQFFKNNWPSSDTDSHLNILNPTTSTPVASDNSVCDSGYESFAQVHRKSSQTDGGSPPVTSADVSSFVANDGPIVDINNNRITCTPTGTSGLSKHHPSGRPTSSLLGSTSTGPLLQPTPSSTPVKTGSDLVPSYGSLSSTNNHRQDSTCTPATTAAPSVTSGLVSKSANNPLTSTNNNLASLTADDLAKLSAGLGLMKLIMTPDVVARQQRSNSLFATTPQVASSLGNTNPWSGQDIYQRFTNFDKIERAATLHRTAASYSEPQYTWSGQLPSRSYKNPVFSCKVFLGGVPWDVTEQTLLETFGRFGPLRIQWPGKDARQQAGQTKAGYVYLIYESERYVKALLQACTQDFGSGSHPEKYYYQLSSRRMRSKEVQAIPWCTMDSNYIRNQSGRPDMQKTVFVGALHGMMTAEGLAKIMNDLFGGVSYVGIDSDKHKYPLGSGRVTFNNQRSYMKAVSAAFIEVKSSQFCKKIQVDPYMEPSNCSVCLIQSGPIHCRDCLRYFCKTCWGWHHSSESLVGRQHRPLMRKKRDI